ncbi:hypothetical protein ECQG_04589 [Escherichia coli TA255]|nr:hypothetical protein ECQG_04589 [Escherichia coli TA255]
MQSWVASFFSPSKASFSGEGYRWSRSIQSRAENALQSRMYMGQQAADAVAGLCCLYGKIIIEAAKHG